MIFIPKYFLIYLISFIIVSFLIWCRIRIEKNISWNKILQLYLIIVFSGIVGVKFFYLMLHNKNLFLILDLNRNGYVLYGGLIFGIFGGYIFAKINNISYYKIMDIVIPYFSLGLAVLHIGCFLYGCCYGIPTNSLLGLEFPNNTSAGKHFHGIPIHPTQIYAVLGDIMIFCILIYIREYKKFNGQIFLSFFILYAFFRMIIDNFRFYNNFERILDIIPITQVLSFVIWSIAIIVYLYKIGFGINNIPNKNSIYLFMRRQLLARSIFICLIIVIIFINIVRVKAGPISTSTGQKIVDEAKKYSTASYTWYYRSNAADTESTTIGTGIIYSYGSKDDLSLFGKKMTVNSGATKWSEYKYKTGRFATEAGGYYWAGIDCSGLVQRCASPYTKLPGFTNKDTIEPYYVEGTAIACSDLGSSSYAELILSGNKQSTNLSVVAIGDLVLWSGHSALVSKIEGNTSGKIYVINALGDEKNPERRKVIEIRLDDSYLLSDFKIYRFYEKETQPTTDDDNGICD